MSFNLVISTGRGVEGKCIAELKRVGELLSVDVRTFFTGFDGLLTGRVSMDPVEFSNKLREMVANGVFIPRFILKVVPIQEVVRTDVDEVVSKVVQMGNSMIAENETYKIEVRRRGVLFDRMAIIDRAAPQIMRRVKLENPDKVIQVEVFPSKTGISVIRESDIFSLLKVTVGGRQGGGDTTHPGSE